MKNRITFILCFILLLFSSLLLTKDVEASNNTSAIEVIGAQIRTTGKQGIRFVSTINFNELEIEKENITSYGTVVAYGECDTDELFLSSRVNNKPVQNAESATLFDEELNTFTVVIYNIDESMYMQKFTARAYIKYIENEVEKVLYSNNVCIRSVYEVASKAYDNGNHDEYIYNIVNYVNTLLSDVVTISEAKSMYDNDNNTFVTIKGIVTSVSSGTYHNATIEDETGALVIYKYNHSTTLANVNDIEELIIEGNEIILTSKLTIFNGLYEAREGTITDCKVLSKGNKTDKYIENINIMNNVSVLDQGKICKGFAKFISKSGNSLTFETLDNQNFIVYVDTKWSNCSNSGYVTNEYYYIDGFVSWYNSAQVIPFGIYSINNLSILEELDETYNVSCLDLTNYNLKITLSNDELIIIPITNSMFSSSDLDKLNVEGEHSLTLNYLSSSFVFNVRLEEKEILNIEAFVNSTYHLNDSFDYNDAYIIITFNDNTITKKAITNEMITNFNTDTKGNKTMTITYKEVEDYVDYVVLAEESKENVIIYEIYGGGGNSGASYNHDYVVLYNNSYFKINLADYYLQYTSSSNATLNNSAIRLNGYIYPNSYFMVKLTSNNTSNGANLPFYSLDCSSAKGKEMLALSASSGKVTLAYMEEANSIESSSIVEHVIYSGLSSSKSYKRNNINEFEFTVNNADLAYLSSDEYIKEVVPNNFKTTYNINESINLATSSLEIYYSSGRKESITVEEENIIGFNTNIIGNFTMTVNIYDRNVYIDYIVKSMGEVPEVNMYFIDLGANKADCGESIYVKVGEDIDILIDCGEASATSAACVNDVLSTYVDDGTLEYVIATHGHSDHIGGMPYVLPNYDIENVIEFYYKFGSTTSSTTVIGKYLNARSKAEHIYTAYELITNNGDGNKYTIDIIENVSMTFYNTNYLTSTDSDNKNAQSVVCCFDIYGNRVLLNGDAEEDQEAVYAPLVGDVDIFKLGHHGTYNATSLTLLNNIRPEVAIVCNGNYLGNKYGHPTHEALSRVYQYSRSCDIYAVTGATITSVKSVTSDMTNYPFDISSKDASILPNMLTAYRRGAGTYKFQYNMREVNDGLGDRNGIITINFTSDSYNITASNPVDNNPIEMSNTAYYTNLLDYLVSVGYYSQSQANSLKHN